MLEHAIKINTGILNPFLAVQRQRIEEKKAASLPTKAAEIINALLVSKNLDPHQFASVEIGATQQWLGDGLANLRGRSVEVITKKFGLMFFKVSSVMKDGELFYTGELKSEKDYIKSALTGNNNGDKYSFIVVFPGLEEYVIYSNEKH